MTEHPGDNDREHIRAVFAEAYRRPQLERVRYLDEACKGDATARAEVESLLRAYEAAGNFLESPPICPGVTLDETPVAEGPGTVVGRYKLLEKIGEGGMAVVYMAEQTEPIRRKVALKIIKLGMDTRQVIARFEAERQALAMMDHPSIAKVLDAGATETGRPYFVMELVQGISITEYCDKSNLSTKDRLALFIQVCQAVQHAHTKGIIHRDIKPTNVMVTHRDGKPIPKVIDFGIAKATNQRLTEKTLYTRYAHIIGTPAYMSPEQAELSDLDIDTRSDIYSLGVLLYELLTGTTPFSEEELRKAGYVEMQRVIREQEPARPSTKLSTLGDTLTDIAKHRGCTADLLRKAVRGDLDWIVMKSLEKDRARRYDTPNALASDILRHLEHEPVMARGPNTTYRLQKLLRKHRSKVLAGVGVAVAVVAAVVLLSMWNRDRRQLAEAEGFKHRNILSQAREQYAKADRDIALEMIKPILDSQHVGPQARLLRASILADNRRFDEATGVLKNLLNDQPEVAGAAHSLLARILWESESPNAAKLKEIEEHRRQAEVLLPETAEAYFLRAMTGITVKEQLASLDKALRLDPGHYESRRLRAYTYYASRKYEKMKDDALVLTILRPRDLLGYSLRAMAWRELSRYAEAIADYDSALGLTPEQDPQYADLCAQRSETLLRMGEYQRIIAETPVVETQDLASLQYHVFCARTALGDYDKAAALFRQIIGPGREARAQFQNWCAKYVFDTFEAGRSWHPVGREPMGAAFLPMAEAEETYRSLTAKGRRLIADGFSARWSPDAKKLAFSAGVHGYSGVALYDPATKETELLIVPGKDPRWSPDGKYIAFVRDCQVLRVPEFVEAERRSQHRAVGDEEIWVVTSDGTEPRLLAHGSWPSWSQDSATIYYQSRADNMLCAIPAQGLDSKPKQLMKCTSSVPSVSPNGQRVAYIERALLKVKDLSTQSLIAEWPLPSAMWGGIAWSPTGRELCLGGRNESNNRTGLWLYRLGRDNPVRVLDGQISVGSWSPDGRKLEFCLAPPYFEIWAADLDPNIPTAQVLGPGQTLDEHLQGMIRLHTRRIEADRLDADAYARRADCYNRLHDRVNAAADMRRWSAAASGCLPCDLPHVIDMPFNCQLVFSAERPANNVPALSVAFGQKGRREMKLFEIPMFITSLFGFCFLSGLDAPPVQANFTFGEPVNLGPVVNGEYPSKDWYGFCVSADGLSLYFGSERPGGYGGADMWVTTRASISDPWGEPVNLEGIVNGPSGDCQPSISADGLSLYFCSDRPGGQGVGDIWVTTRPSLSHPWGEPVNLGGAVNGSQADCNPSISADGLSLFFDSTREKVGTAHPNYCYIYVTTRPTTNGSWGAAVRLGPTVNAGLQYDSGYASISADGKVLFFSSNQPVGVGTWDLWMVTRATKDDEWGIATNLGPTVNDFSHDFWPRISGDGSTLFFWSQRPGGFGTDDIWQVPILPLVDFNSDGKIDGADLDLLLANWGKSNSVCDIGPFPWGDGVVDEKDLAVLMESLVTPTPKASDVPCNVVLSWVRPSSMKYCDIYFGKSLKAVSDANRDNTKDVMVGYIETATTYDPNGLLECSTTYYWRIDFVNSGLVAYKGPILSFTTEPFSRPIKNVIATASSGSVDTGPGKTVDGSGLDTHDGHSTNGTDMWLSGPAGPHWIMFEFDKVYALDQMWAWNSNQAMEPTAGFGAREVTIEYSVDGAAWTPLADVPEFARAPGTPGYVHNTTVSFGGVSAKLVRLNIAQNWGGLVAMTGLSEVRFFYIPTATAAQP